MALLRFDPWAELATLQRDVNELFSRGAGQPVRQGLIPPMDAYRSDEALVLRVDLPGIAPDDVELSVQEGVLSISGQRGRDAGVAEDSWLRQERPVGEFTRTVTLPEDTDADSIEASFEHGVLEVRVPNPPERKPRRIEIKAGQGGQRTVDVG